VSQIPTLPILRTDTKTKVNLPQGSEAAWPVQQGSHHPIRHPQSTINHHLKGIKARAPHHPIRRPSLITTQHCHHLPLPSPTTQHTSARAHEHHPPNPRS
jgi:hypothetical protein